MKTIYKYPLEITRQQVVKIAAGAQLLSLQMQDGVPTLWALIHDDGLKLRYDNVVVLMYGTGHDMKETLDQYLGTVQDGPYVWHFFTQPLLVPR